MIHPSGYAKALVAFVGTFLALLSATLGIGGVDAVAAMTLGQWLIIFLASMTTSGAVYGWPNTPPTPGAVNNATDWDAPPVVNGNTAALIDRVGPYVPPTRLPFDHAQGPIVLDPPAGT